MGNKKDEVIRREKKYEFAGKKRLTWRDAEPAFVLLVA